VRRRRAPSLDLAVGGGREGGGGTGRHISPVGSGRGGAAPGKKVGEGGRGRGRHRPPDLAGAEREGRGRAGERRSRRISGRR